jgi:Glycosyl hydrolases family 2, TIM barrel domain
MQINSTTIPVICIIGACFLSACATNESTKTEPVVSKATIQKTNEGFELLVNGEPFFIEGAGLEFGSIPELAKNGGNAFRTWRTENGQRSGKEVLDEAQQYGLKVMMGIDIARERHGFDYNDPVAVQKQLEDVRQQVLALKDHPALIIWGIGNELNLLATNPKVWDAVNDISKMIHEIDPNHLTTTSLAGIDKQLVDHIKQRAPDLDLLSVQMYGDIINLPKYIKESGWEGPFLVTEWGATGHWEVPLTQWGAPIENNSTVKAGFYKDRYQNSILPLKGQCLGSFVFLWGQKQERTPTWYGTFLADGQATETIDVMHYLWNDVWPENVSPRIDSIFLHHQVAQNNIRLEAGKTYPAAAYLKEPDNDSITYLWEIMEESKAKEVGGDVEAIPTVLKGLIPPGQSNSITFTAPADSGAYRLFLYASDKKGHAAHANIPFYVEE